MIVVDDGSHEDIEAAVKGFRDDRIKYIRHPQNKGVCAARNSGIHSSQGDLIAFLDSDDEFLPEKLEKQVETFQNLDKDTALVTTNLFESKNRGPCYVPEQVNSAYVTPAIFPATVFSPPSAWMLLRKCVDQVGYFDENMAVNEDADYYVRILEKYRIYYLNQALSIKTPSFDRKGHYSEKYFSGKELFLKKHLLKMKKSRRYLSRFYFCLGKDYLNANKVVEAQKPFLNAFLASFRLSYFLKYLQTVLALKGEKWVR